ncbi:MAG: GC-type dockerin domain-anchored protein [Phycisphaerales bacterium]
MRRAICAGLLLVTPASGQVISAAFASPDADRWNYPFNATPGTRETSPSFGAVLIAGFDDRDSQFLVAYDTGGQVPGGLATDRYHIASVTLTAVVSNDNDFVYDDSYDAFATYLDPLDPGYVADADPGRALELFGVGFRNGVDSTTWTETSAFGGAAVVPPAQGARNAFAAEFDDLSAATDVSNNLKDAFDPTPWAIGTTGAVAPGALVPVDTEFTFEVDLCVPGVRENLRRSLAEGRVLLTITSLQAASGSPDGGEGVVYPVWYTRENAIAQILGYEPTLTIELRVGNAADIDGNGTLNIDDIDAFVAAFLAGEPTADIDGSCTLNIDDIDAFVAAFLGG